MHKTYILLLVFFALPFTILHAQQGDLKAYYSQKSYDQYLAEDWSGIIETAKEANQKNVDFYYLRLRTGIAYAAQYNYRLAIENYKKAIVFVPNDPVAQEYLYYAYLAAGEKKMAYLYVSSLPSTLRKKINPEKPSAIGNIYLETGLAFVEYSDDAFTFPSESYFSELFVRKSQTYANVNFLLNIAKPISLGFSYTGLGIKSEHQFKIKNFDPGMEELNVSQNDFSMQVNIHGANGLTLIPFIHNVNTALTVTEFYYDTTSYTLEPNVDITYNATTSTLQWNDPLIGFGFVKKSGLFDISASFSYAWLSLMQQQQLNVSLSYLPRGNYSLYFKPEVRFLNEEDNFRMIYKLSAGYSISTKIWTEMAFSYGNLQRTHEGFGAIVYNLPDVSKFKTDAVINYGFSNGVSLSLRYQLTRKESALTSYNLITSQTSGGTGFGQGSTVSETDWLESETLFPFNQHFIILGFNWAL